VTGAAALAEGVVDTRTQITCQGKLYIPNKYFPDDPTKAQPFRCWASWGHGPLNIYSAIAQSCNIYFGVVAGGYGSFEGLGMDRLEEYARAFGFGAPTRIDLPGESSGLYPTIAGSARITVKFGRQGIRSTRRSARAMCW